MGYETKLYICEGYDKVGYMSVIASVDLCKCANGALGDLIGKLEKERMEFAKKSGLDLLLKEYNDLNEEFGWVGKLTSTEEISKEEKKGYDNLWKVRRKIEKLTNHIFVGDEAYTDCYGVPLMITDLRTIRDAIEKASEQDAKKNNGQTYRRFDIALALLNGFISNISSWGDETIRVVLYGH